MNIQQFVQRKLHKTTQHTIYSPDSDLNVLHAAKFKRWLSYTGGVRTTRFCVYILHGGQRVKRSVTSIPFVQPAVDQDFSLVFEVWNTDLGLYWQQGQLNHAVKYRAI